jgi:hypothetical protein
VRELASPAVASPAVRPREVPARVEGLERGAADGATVAEDRVEAVAAADLAVVVVVGVEVHLAALAGADATVFSQG